MSVEYGGLLNKSVQRYQCRAMCCIDEMYILKNLNKGSDTIEVLPRQFMFRGNTAKAKKHRGRVAHAKAALQHNH